MHDITDLDFTNIWSFIDETTDIPTADILAVPGWQY